ncbi:MAG: GNAT family N-acetyltransferase [Lachnospiraceae bacterium]|jgi:RimJ/RimL family protein N-acetyltransferase|nr:GNAT family N-acetyltransferase [Lachnospiraceae bacterium]MCI1397559.1 GNAT family N-acetyltransferase [Lachnospiraceae bacterium]MCI1423206.1 GNAT family N-acetyltransferase [Lachnospiraceae bacterium]MCI1452670.1 GNAT family N-acetyltransferase [Lachnospiraceae bacterium]
MIAEPNTLFLPGKRTAVFATPGPEHAAEFVDYLKQSAGETEFLIRYPEELADLTAERESAFLAKGLEDPDSLLIGVWVDGRLAGSGALSVPPRKKLCHRGEVSLSLLRPYWGLGLGAALLEQLEKAGRNRALRQLELTYIDGNERGRRLYDRMGYQETGRLPDAVRRRDGTYRDFVQMWKVLSH